MFLNYNYNKDKLTNSCIIHLVWHFFYLHESLASKISTIFKKVCKLSLYKHLYFSDNNAHGNCNFHNNVYNDVDIIPCNYILYNTPLARRRACSFCRICICVMHAYTLCMHIYTWYLQLPKERARVYRAGGTIDLGRINGNLNLSRAIGDWYYKMNNRLPLQDQMVTSYPDVKEETLVADDEFLVSFIKKWTLVLFIFIA